MSGPDLDSSCLTLVVLVFFEKGDFGKNQQTTKKHEMLGVKALLVQPRLIIMYVG